MNKRGQFYLIAALVIIAIIAGLMRLDNYASNQKEDSEVYALAKEINFETAQVLDRGIFQNLPEEQVASQINILSRYYAETYPNNEFLFVLENRNNFNLSLYKKTETESSFISFPPGSTTKSFQLGTSLSGNLTLHESENYAELIFSNKETYRFNLQEGRNIFVLIRKQNSRETFISSSA